MSKQLSQRKILLVSVKFFVSAILGPEMAAPILRAPGKMRSFCRRNLHVHKIPRFWGGGVFWVRGGGSVDFILMGEGIFLKLFWWGILKVKIEIFKRD